MKIVIAEDDSGSRRLLSRMLEGLSFEVAAMQDGQEAWEHIQAAGARLLITDWRMPGLDGLDLCRRVRLLGSTSPYVYVIVMTGLDRRENRLKALQAGADDFVTKPFDKAELLARINVARRIMVMEEQLRWRSSELERKHAELERHNSHLSEVATSDGLTGLKNHRYFRESLEAHFSLSRRKGMPLSLVMLDVDHFKPFNDTFGHPAGDAALSEVAGLLRTCVRDHDVVARYGGEEFAVLLPATDTEAAIALGERLRAVVADHPWGLRPITISLGLSTSCSKVSRAIEMIEFADRSLYRSKAGGRDRVTHARDLPDRFPGDGPHHPPLLDVAGMEDMTIAPFLG